MQSVLYFGHKKIYVCSGEQGVNNSLLFKGMGEFEYAGFCGGLWRDPSQLGTAIAKALKAHENNCGFVPQRIFVGVPADFLVYSVSKTDLFNKARRITQADINEVLQSGVQRLDMDDAFLCDIKPIYYVLDNDFRTLDPLRIMSARLGGAFSCGFATQEFLQPLIEAFHKMGIYYSFISEPSAKLSFLFSRKLRENGLILLDIGCDTSAVMLGKGEGILMLSNFALGSSSILFELVNRFDISVQLAQSLMQKVVLTLALEDNDVYEIEGRDQIFSFPSRIVNQIIKERLDAIGYMIVKCLNACDYEMPENIRFFLCGEGLSELKGARDILSVQLKKRIELATPRQPLLHKPIISSYASLLHTAIHLESQKEQVFSFAKLKQLI